MGDLDAIGREIAELRREVREVAGISRDGVTILKDRGWMLAEILQGVKDIPDVAERNREATKLYIEETAERFEEKLKLALDKFYMRLWWPVLALVIGSLFAGAGTRMLEMLHGILK